MTIQVIGAGFGRTGTDSMREALVMLGFGPCHHMFEVNANEEQRRLWRALAQGAEPAWDRLLKGYRSCVDWPSAFYWRELMTYYPNAKVILTYRSPDSWWQSFEKTILAYINSQTDQDSLVATLIARQVFGGRPNDRSHAIACYEANVKEVKERVATTPPAPTREWSSIRSQLIRSHRRLQGDAEVETAQGKDRVAAVAPPAVKCGGEPEPHSPPHTDGSQGA
jgi:hypothetical protein